MKVYLFLLLFFSSLLCFIVHSLGPNIISLHHFIRVYNELGNGLPIALSCCISSFHSFASPSQVACAKLIFSLKIYGNSTSLICILAVKHFMHIIYLDPYLVIYVFVYISIRYI